MSVVVINVLSVPGGDGRVLEERFAGRAGLVHKAEGFEGFELLRPVDGTDRYLVYTRWRSEEDFQAWQSSRDFAKGHAQAARDRGAERPASTAGEVWQFEVVQRAIPADGAQT
jgi:heme-degrading monooxygenase HmoA